MKKIRLSLGGGDPFEGDGDVFVIEECEGRAEIRRERAAKIDAGPTATTSFSSFQDGRAWVDIKVELLE